MCGSHAVPCDAKMICRNFGCVEVKKQIIIVESIHFRYVFINDVSVKTKVNEHVLNIEYSIPFL